MKFKICVSQLIAKILPKNPRHGLTGYIQIWHHILSKKKYFIDFQNRVFSVLWIKSTKLKKQSKIRNFLWEIFKSDVMYFSLKIIKVFQWLSKSKFLSSMTKANPKNWNQTK